MWHATGWSCALCLMLLVYGEVDYEEGKQFAGDEAYASNDTRKTNRRHSSRRQADHFLSITYR